MSPEVVPYHDVNEPKKNQVRKMFDSIAHSYDFLNHFLSFGADYSWRKKAIRRLKSSNPIFILDVATGTGDFALAALKINPSRVVGIDISEEMLRIARKKIAASKSEGKIEFQWADAESLPFQADSFDAATIAFGVRNFENPLKGLSEIYRVLNERGTLVVLEFSNPGVLPFSQIYRFYFSHIIPLLGRWISKDKSAYSYLPDSVLAFPQGDEFLALLKQAGFSRASCTPLSFGIVSLYFAEK